MTAMLFVIGLMRLSEVHLPIIIDIYSIFHWAIALYARLGRGGLVDA